MELHSTHPPISTPRNITKVILFKVYLSLKRSLTDVKSWKKETCSWVGSDKFLTVGENLTSRLPLFNMAKSYFSFPCMRSHLGDSLKKKYEKTKTKMQGNEENIQRYFHEEFLKKYPKPSKDKPKLKHKNSNKPISTLHLPPTYILIIYML